MWHTEHFWRIELYSACADILSFHCTPTHIYTGKKLALRDISFNMNVPMELE